MVKLSIAVGGYGELIDLAVSPVSEQPPILEFNIFQSRHYKQLGEVLIPNDNPITIYRHGYGMLSRMGKTWENDVAGYKLSEDDILENWWILTLYEKPNYRPDFVDF